MSSRTQKPQNLSDAIRQLEEVARAKAGDLKQVLGNDFDQFQKAVDDIKPYVNEVKSQATATASENVRQAYDHARETAYEKFDSARESAVKVGRTVDESVHESPWVSIGVVGFIALIIGYLMGRKD